VDKVIKSQFTIDEYRYLGLTEVELERQIRTKLIREMESMLINKLDITSVNIPHTSQKTYTGTLAVGSGNTLTTGATGATGPSSWSAHNVPVAATQPELRVVEFMKKGKVARVELQHYTIMGWKKVPRIQIEE
jgi:hypothetical protein